MDVTLIETFASDIFVFFIEEWLIFKVRANQGALFFI
jgi:hypothetical protein